MPRQARVGGLVAGRAFRNILGLAWKFFESGEPVLRRQVPAITMNNDGGQGGFNPGRGGFSAGRGGYGVVAASKVAVPSKAGALVLRMDDKTWATPVAAMAMVLLVVASKGTL
jgi:hypothetical protein